MAWIAMARRNDAARSARNASRIRPIRAASPSRPSVSAAAAASSKPRSAQSWSQYECMGFAEYPS